MKYLIVTNIMALAFLCLLVGLVLHNQPGKTAVSASQVTPTEYLTEILHQGLGNDSDGAQRDALIEIALEGQSLHPTAAEELWAQLHEYYASKPDYDRVVGLTIYLDSVNDAITSCDSLETFDTLWAVRNDIQEERRKSIEGWRKSLQTELQTFRVQIEQHGLTKAFEDSTAANQERLQNQVRLFTDLAEQAGVSLPDEIGMVAQAAKKDFLHRISQIAAGITSCQELKEENIEPASSDSGKTHRGVCQCILVQLQKVMDDANEEYLAFWLNQTAQTPSNATSADESVMEKIAACAELTRKLQQLHYNQWALRVIEGANDLDSWYEDLGVIEIGYLHPSVHSLYASTHDKQLNAEKDFNNRMTAVGVLLSQKKVPLEAF